MKKAKQDLKKVRLVIDSVSELTALSNPKSVIKYLQTLTARIRIDEGIAICTVASGAHDEHFINLLRLIFDGILEMRIDESDNEMKRLLRLFSLKGAQHKTKWIPFVISDNGIIMESDTELRCALCSKTIDWEPIKRIIDGKKLYFDSHECLSTYNKFKSIYGTNFE
jgi:KaiC/GvpD/RAD55 family RecA-like ATPase